MKLVVTGATGFLGVPLVAALRARGDAVTVLTRSAANARKFGAGVTVVEADLETPGRWCAALAGHDAILHLAGESVAAKRWTARQKQIIRDSRIEATRTIVEAVQALPIAERPRTLIAMSGVDYYPYASNQHDFDDDEVTEADPPSESFLGRVCRDWEKEAAAAEAFGTRVVRMRTGIVFGEGGPMDQMSAPFRLFAGGKIGDGRQWVSWIHRDDALAALLAALDDARYTGPINLVTDSARNADVAKAIGHQLHRPSWLPVPGFALEVAVGEFAEVLLNGRRVVPTRLRELGFTWKLPTLAAALAYLH